MQHSENVVSLRVDDQAARSDRLMAATDFESNKAPSETSLNDTPSPPVAAH